MCVDTCYAAHAGVTGLVCLKPHISSLGESSSWNVIKATGAMNDHPNVSDVGQRARRRIAWRLLPFLFILYFIAYLDRVNVGFAGLEMSHNLGFTDRVFGFGAGIFLQATFCLRFRARSSWNAGVPGAGLPAS